MPSLPSIRFLAAARRLATLVPMGDDDAVAFGLPDIPGAAAVLRYHTHRFDGAWSSFAADLMSEEAPGDSSPPFMAIAPDRIAGKMVAATVEEFGEGTSRIHARWREAIGRDLNAGAVRPLGDHIPVENLARVPSDILIELPDPLILRILWEPKEASAHERLEFEMALRAVLDGIR
ncbi:hypothetical protein [Magnetospirillum sp. ME-1]|uniref:hypothetical protein n=1 Tax=Magnetospirillum sp. ME-1 TaxID=1639348 RepID=UPI0011AE1A1F|nr:hypothetical protein [Magnetospirillum sp. ME-1]